MLVKPGDAQTLAERIGLLLDRPDIREVMAERARETARSHDADIVARRLALDIDRITQPPLT
jgi:glycosyltransferase involved in cell wall biosynthesis